MVADTISVTATSIDLEGTAYTATVGNATFTGAVDLDGGDITTTVTTSAGGGDIIFTSTVNDNIAGETNLVLVAGAGDVDLRGTVGVTIRIDDFTVTSAANADLLNVVADTISVTATSIDLESTTYTAVVGNATFTGAVDLDLAAGTTTINTATANTDIIFTSTIDDNIAKNTDLVLVAGTGDVDLRGDVGVTIAIDDFTVTSAANADLISVVADTITVTATSIDLEGTAYTSVVGDATFTGAVDLDGGAITTTVTTSASNTDIIFTSTIDDNIAGQTDLTLVAGTGDVDLRGNVGATIRVDDFTVTSAANADLLNVIADAIAVTATSIDLESTTYTAVVDNATFTGRVDLDLAAGTTTVTTSAGGGDIVFTSTIDDNIAKNTNLVLVAGAGDVDLRGDVSDTIAINDFTVTSAANADLVNVIADTISVTATSIDLEGTTYNSVVGNATFTGAVDLDAGDTTVSINTSANNTDIIFTSTINDNIAGETDLTLVAGTGDVDLRGNVGATIRVDDFTVTSAANADLINVVADTISVTATSIDLEGTAYTATVGNATFTGAVDLDGGAITTTVTTSAGGGDIIFTSTINDNIAGETDLTLVAGAGDVDLRGTVGVTIRIDDFTVTSAANADLLNVIADTISVTATSIDLESTTYTAVVGNATFTGAVDLDLAAGTTTINTATANTDIIFTSTIDDNIAKNTDLVLVAGTGDVDLRGDVGVTIAIDDFTVTSAANADLISVVADTITVTATSIDLEGTAYTSVVGNATFTGAVDLDGGAITTTVTTSASNTDIIFTSTINDNIAGETDLTLVAGTGDVDLRGNVGATIRVDDFTVTSAATADLLNVIADTISVTATSIDLESTTYTATVGNATFTGAVDLDAGAVQRRLPPRRVVATSSSHRRLMIILPKKLTLYLLLARVMLICEAMSV